MRFIKENPELQIQQAVLGWIAACAQMATQTIQLNKK